MSEYLTHDQAVAALVNTELNKPDEAPIVREERAKPQRPSAEDTGIEGGFSEDDPDDLSLDLDDEGAEEPLIDHEEEDTGEEHEGDNSPPIEAPKQWDAEMLEDWKQLPKSLQMKLLEREKKSASETGKKIQAAAESSKRYDNEAKALAAHRAEVERVLSSAKQYTADQYANVDWAMEFEKDFQNATIHKARYDKQQADIAKLEQLHNANRVQAQAEFVYEQQKRLEAMAAEDEFLRPLVDEKTGLETKKKLGEWLVNSFGVTAQQLNGVSAGELALAYHAFKMTDLRVKHKAKQAQPKSQPAQNQSTKVRTPAVSSQPKTTRMDEQWKRLEKSGSPDDAKALLLMRMKQRK